MTEQTLPPLSAERSIPARIANIVAERPQDLALASATHAWSFARLQDEATHIARALLRDGTDHEVPIALMMRHDAPLIASILGTLLAGRCFAVLDPAFPVARNRAIVDNLGAQVLLADAANAADAATVAGPLRRMRIMESLPDSPAIALPGLDASPESWLGIFHTTGTTGEPKGVLWRQSLSLRRAMTDRDDVPLMPRDRFALLTALCFPAAVSDTFNALLNGASLHLYDMRTHGPTWLVDWLRQQGIDHLRAPVALFRFLQGSLAPGERLAELKSVGLSGDALNRQDVLTAWPVLPPECRIIHRYSMSEAGMVARDVFTRGSEITHDIVPPGFPAPGKRLRILEDDGSATPDGNFGEVCLDLDGCAAGYWRRGRLEALPSVPDPLAPGRRLYRSGDIGRIGPDGRLELSGRQDHRVKIRGYRVELPAVEVALRGLECVRDAAVAVAADTTGEKALAAFVVASEGVGTDDIRSELASVLPDHMLPSRFVLLERLPLAGNGKLDRKALCVPHAPASHSLEAPRSAASDAATGVCRIFSALLGRPEIGIDDDFFALGGHSLLAARALARVEATFGCRIALASFYRAPTAAATAATIEAGGDETEKLPDEVVESVRRQALYELGWLP